MSGAIDVTDVPARLSVLRHVVTANGEVTPQPDADWTIHASEPAIVQELPVEEGAPVEAGAIVARFEVPSRTAAIQAAEIELQMWTSKVESARTRVNELSALFERGLTARIEVDGAKTELATRKRRWRPHARHSAACAPQRPATSSAHVSPASC